MVCTENPSRHWACIVVFVQWLKSFLTYWDPMNCSIPGFPLLHYLLEFAHTHVHWVSNAIHLSHPLSLASPPALSLSGSASGSFPKSWLFASGGQSIGASASASVLPIYIESWSPLGLIGLFSSVAQSWPTLCDPMDFSTRPPCPSPIPRVYSNSCSFSQWCHPTISSSVVPFSFHLQSFPASGSFQMSQLFASGGQNIGDSASTSVLPMNTQDWSPLGWTSWISLQFKGISRVFSNTTVQKHQFFSTQLSLLSNSHIHTWLLEKP